MSQCLFCENSLEMYCQECQESYCHHCGIIKHLRNGLIQPHVINYLCEECEEEVSTTHCKSCEQNLCPGCDTKIHNKGKRAQHTREPITNCLCMKDIKLVAHLTLSFLKEYCDTTDTDKFSEQLAEMSASVLKTQKDWNEQNIIYISVLEDESGEISPEELKTLRDALKLIRIKNFLLFEGGTNQEAYASFKQSIAKEPSLNSNLKPMQATLTDAYKIYQILKDVKDIENIYIFDTERNEAFACALHTTPTLESKKFFLNFDLVNPLSFGVSAYVPIQPKGQSEEQKISSPTFPKQKILPEPFLPQALLENNLMDRKEAGKNDLDYSDYWTQTNSPREDYQKPNQSYDEILLNMSSDQVLQRRSAAFIKNQQQYSYLNQGNSQRRQSILIDQPLKTAELGGSLKLSHITQQELRKFANKGDLLVIREDLVKNLTKALQAAKITFNVDELLKQAEDAKIIHTTIRKFLETKPISYIGILLDWLSVESLVWIVKSIKNDLMTPSEKLILSRVKECYGLKIEQNFWKSIINYILSNQNQKQNRANSYDQTSAFPLYANKILDPVTNTDTFVIYLTNDAWTPEDQGTVDENSEEWKGFLTFIGNFFKEDENSIDQKSNYIAKVANQEADSQDQSKRATWSSSVENVLNRSTNKKEKSLKISEDVKAIPGGRYGCAQFIKICGPSVLKKLSIGRLTLFVQEAINKGILRYQRTLLVKNNPNDSINTLTEVDGVNNSFSQDPAAERKSKLIKTVKEVLIEILSETPEGIPLAQIPLHLKRKMDYVINFQDLGFPKLKNFLATLPDLVKIESSGTNHAFVKLTNPVPANSRKNPPFKDQVFLPEEQNSARQQYSTVNQSSMFQNNNNNNNMTVPNFVNYDQANIDSMKYKMASKKNSNLVAALEKNLKGTRRNLSSLDDYLNKVRGIIELILTDNCYGISMQTLYKELSSKLGCEFDVRLFHCKDFYDFLTNHVENLLDIEIKRNCLIIYPKNFRFGPQTLVNMVNTDQQRTSIKAGDFCEPGPDSKRNYPNSQYNQTTSPFHGNKGFSDLEAPPGLTKSSSFKPTPSGFNMPYNPVGFSNNFPQARSNMKANDNGNTPNLSTISPVGFYVNDDNEAASERYMQAQSQSVSYWKVADFIGSHINIDEGRQGMNSRSQINGGLHSRNDSRGIRTQVQEESNLDIRENLKFIEELLQDNDFEKSMMTNFTLDRTTESSFGGIQSPNLSFMGLTAIGHVNQTSKQNHSKTQSEDFSTKNILKFSVGGHGRVCSVIPDRKNE